MAFIRSGVNTEDIEEDGTKAAEGWVASVLETGDTVVKGTGLPGPGAQNTDGDVIRVGDGTGDKWADEASKRVDGAAVPGEVSSREGRMEPSEHRRGLFASVRMSKREESSVVGELSVEGNGRDAEDGRS